jgi:hypothetical protein
MLIEEVDRIDAKALQRRFRDLLDVPDGCSARSTDHCPRDWAANQTSSR